jgi:hypothetical protein
MVVEHIFITTLERDDALVLADAFFKDLGFESDTSDDGAPEWSAGSDRPKSLPEFKRIVQVGFDRGRITLGASAPKVDKPNEKIFAPYMLALASSLEAHISLGQPVEEAAAPVRAAMKAIEKRERHARLARYIILGVVLLFVAGIILLIALKP